MKKINTHYLTILLCLVLLHIRSSLIAANLYNNGPFITSLGSGAGGADESILQFISLNMANLGFGHQIQENNIVSDDFIIPTGEEWQIDNIVFYAYQRGVNTSSTITDVRFQIWDGIPTASSSKVIFGDLTNNRLVSTTWSGVYRVNEFSLGNSQRAIMRNTTNANVKLGAGTYWITWQVGGSGFSGPWTPPITIIGQSTTGNGLQSTNGGVSYNDALDGGTSTQQGFPFIIQGSLVEDVIIPTISQWGLLIFGLLILNLSLFWLRKLIFVLKV